MTQDRNLSEIDRSDNLKPSSVKAFNTRDCLLALFYQDFRIAKKLPTVALDPHAMSRPDGGAGLDEKSTRQLTHMNSELGAFGSEMAALAADNLKNDVNSVKVVLAASQDSGKRKELVQRISVIDPKITSLNVQVEGTAEKAKDLIKQFWSIVLQAMSEGKQLDAHPQLARVMSQYNELRTKSSAVKDLHEMTKKETQALTIDTEKLTGAHIERQADKTPASTPPSPQAGG